MTIFDRDIFVAGSCKAPFGLAVLLAWCFVCCFRAGE